MSPRSLIGFVLGLGALACSADSAPPPAAPQAAAQRSSAEVRWRPARAPGRTALLEAPARVLPAAAGRAVVAAPLRARIVSIAAVAGDEVAAGAPLLEIAMPEAAVAAAEYLAAVDQLAAQERRNAQLTELRALGLTRTSELAAIELELARLRGARELAAATLRSANLSLGDARALAARGGRTTLRAPRAGRITQLAAVIGAVAAPDDVLVEVSGGGSTRVEVALSYPLPPSSRFEIELATETREARLVGLAPDRARDGTTRAWFDVDVAQATGALGRLRVLPPQGTAVLVPATALSRDAAGAYVWRRDRDRPRRLGVQVLVTSGADALVAGPKEGDAIASIASAVAEETP
ncbi:MAG: efflux RND transporter periplasmic adaptor subunit [Kofleriaceae bacterium]